jgi:hypothetical protein
MISNAVEYYQRILTSRSWFAEGLSWTVIQPASQQLTVAEVMRRLHAERVNLDELDEWADDHDDHDPLLIACLAQIGPNVVMFQDNGFEGSRPEILRWLSDGARVHNVDWTINGNGSLSYAVYGKVLARIDKNNPDRKYGEDPTALDEDLADMHAARQALDLEDQADLGETSQTADPSVPSALDTHLLAEAAAMATVEHRTGIRLTEQWLDNLGAEPWQAVMLGKIPSDPRPPSGFGDADPDLDARLRAAPEQMQRAALVLVMREIATRFILTDGEAAQAAIDAVSQGRTLASEVREHLFHLGASSGDPQADGLSAGAVFYTATAPPHGYDDRFGALGHVRNALPEDWPRLRRTISDLVRASGHQARG